MKGEGVLDRSSFERFVDLGIFGARRRIGRSGHRLINGSAKVLAVVLADDALEWLIPPMADDLDVDAAVAGIAVGAAVEAGARTLRTARPPSERKVPLTGFTE
ncbi:hypothetical protein [Pseudomonas sp. IT-P12]|uniref:hypothetical protein n=1 Tax=Pseudomonas sp. IT-P12 TaxID=3026450 RepID=UPI0039E13D88